MVGDLSVLRISTPVYVHLTTLLQGKLGGGGGGGGGTWGRYIVAWGNWGGGGMEVAEHWRGGGGAVVFNFICASHFVLLIIFPLAYPHASVRLLGSSDNSGEFGLLVFIPPPWLVSMFHRYMCRCVFPLDWGYSISCWQKCMVTACTGVEWSKRAWKWH